MENWKKAVINSGIMSGITFFSTCVSTGGVITNQSFTAAIIAFGITFLTLLSKYFTPPTGDVNDEEVVAVVAAGELKTEPVSDGGCANMLKVIGMLWV